MGLPWIFLCEPPTLEGQFDMEIELGFDIKSDDLQNHDI
jgi:hypothetical protein